MYKLSIYALAIALGLISGAGLGAILPLLVATIEQQFRTRFTTDPSASGFGFLVLITVPIGAFYGIFLGWKVANRFLQSKEGLNYLTHGEGMISLSFIGVGFISAAFLYWKFKYY